MGPQIIVPAHAPVEIANKTPQGRIEVCSFRSRSLRVLNRMKGQIIQRKTARYGCEP